MSSKENTSNYLVYLFPDAYDTTISWSSSMPTTVPVCPRHSNIPSVHPPWPKIIKIDLTKSYKLTTMQWNFEKIHILRNLECNFTFHTMLKMLNDFKFKININKITNSQTMWTRSSVCRSTFTEQREMVFIKCSSLCIVKLNC